MELITDFVVEYLAHLYFAGVLINYLFGVWLFCAHWTRLSSTRELFVTASYAVFTLWLWVGIGVGVWAMWDAFKKGHPNSRSTKFIKFLFRRF